ncbi:hypothetical protein HBI56_233550 [Parastagonospora nodorum]|nr:hypothetical protein HBH53_075400 [Parastagonospora nodorum]KAH3965897.1 hypothetical protein HBH51_146360 [Parastagonospora nodorum]KAH3998460.1 hypothetical protein HBI10_123380 [Parastagonospora nodorum]KAH4008140.1 hypothetical protein HBI13_241610 [Parastagonospora nodorum]KAH4009544.1 hypothetical protein HBI09_235020 [Parastagonospora nodorum]
MGLRPLDTAPRDVVVVVGGPDTAFIVRDSSMKAMAELVPLPFDSPRRDLGKHTEVVRTTTGTPVSQLLGTCYLQSVMSGEMDEEDTARWKGIVDWEEDRAGRIPKQTIYIV